MTVEDSSNSCAKEIVTVTEHCRDLNLSRSRYYQLVKAGIFLPPIYDVTTKRGHVPREIQEANLQARRRNCGVNGKPILFYAKPMRATPVPSRPRRQPAAARPPEQHKELTEAIKAMGLQVSAADVAAAVKACFPKGMGEITGQVIRSIFLHLRAETRRNTGDNVR